MGHFITTQVKSGDWPNKVPASFFNKVDAVLSNLEVKDGSIERNGDKWIIVPNQGRAIPTGGSAGDVLTIGSGGDLQWETPGAC